MTSPKNINISLYKKLRGLNRTMFIQIICPSCGEKYELHVNPQDYADFKAGRRHVQNAFPYLNPGERELFISGICNECWGKIFPDEE